MSIRDDYKVVNIIEEQSYQTISLGVDDLGEMALINEISNLDGFDKELIKSYRSISHSILDLTLSDDKLEIIQTYVEGLSLDTYMSNIDLSSDNRIELVEDYFKFACKMDQFPLWLQHILLDSEQVYIENDTLMFKQYLMLQDLAFDDFQAIQKDIFTTISQLLNTEASYNDFLMNLKEHSNDYKNINDVRQAFEDVRFKDFAVVAPVESQSTSEVPELDKPNESPNSIAEESHTMELHTLEEPLTIEQTDIAIDHSPPTEESKEKIHKDKPSSDQLDAIQEILDRNDQNNSDMYIEEKKPEKSSAIPLFIAFFIFLLVTTVVLLNYINNL